jgi:hypothetical protein
VKKALHRLLALFRSKATPVGSTRDAIELGRELSRAARTIGELATEVLTHAADAPNPKAAARALFKIANGSQLIAEAASELAHAFVTAEGERSSTVYRPVVVTAPRGAALN